MMTLGSYHHNHIFISKPQSYCEPQSYHTHDLAYCHVNGLFIGFHFVAMLFALC